MIRLANFRLSNINLSEFLQLLPACYPHWRSPAEPPRPRTLIPFPILISHMLVENIHRKAISVAEPLHHLFHNEQDQDESHRIKFYSTISNSLISSMLNAGVT